MTDLLDLLLRVAVFVFGVLTVANTVKSGIKTFVVPRAVNTRLTRIVFMLTRLFFAWRPWGDGGYAARDRRMALYAPVSLLVLPVVWITLVWVGYACVYWALGIRSADDALTLSGSSLLTLGTVPFTSNLLVTVIEFSEAVLGLGLMALLIAYLPTMYSAFSERESIVSMLEVRAGDPPSVETFIQRIHGIQGLDNMRGMWSTYEQWFTRIEESHTSLSALVFFRSPHPSRSWVTAAGAIMDTAAFFASTVDRPRQPEAQLCIRAGFLALRSIADFFQIDYVQDPHFPDHPISISREEYDAVYDALLVAGVPLKPDRDQAWRDFAGWRVNYDDTLLQLCALTLAPYAPWSSDRSRPNQGEAISWRTPLPAPCATINAHITGA